MARRLRRYWPVCVTDVLAGRTNRSVVVWGASGHAAVVADIVRLMGFEVRGFIDEVNTDLHGKSRHGGIVLGGRESLVELTGPEAPAVVVGIGDNRVRARIAQDVENIGFDLFTVIHPGSIVADNASMGAGTVVAAGSVINPCCIIGKNVIVNTSATVDHHCTLGNGVHIAPGAILCGGVDVGTGSFIGAGSVVREKVRIGAGVVVGAGSVVVSDIPDGVMSFGNPARIVRDLAQSVEQA